MNVLIINLTRFGDLIQTQPVISGFARAGNRVGLACVDNFASATSLLRDLDTVFPFPGARLLSLLDKNWRESLGAICDYRDMILSSFTPDVVVNLTPSVPARLLSRSLEASRVCGFSLDEHGFNADTSPWAAFLQVAGNNRGSSPFNICDLFLRAADLNGDPEGLRLADPGAEHVRTAKKLLHLPEIEHAGFVALQPGASEERRRWPVGRFAAMADELWQQRRLVSVVLGTQGEAALGKRIEESADCPVMNLQGRTSLPELAAVLRQCCLLITNDTGTMHLAAGMGTPVVSVFLATAQPWDTGPYREQCLCLEPDLDCHPCAFGAACAKDNACREAVPVEAVSAAVRRVLDGEGEVVSGARAWVSQFDEQGFLTQNSVSGHGSDDRTRWIELQRVFYRRFLDGDSLEGLSRFGDEMSPQFVEALQSTLSSARDYLFLMQQQGALLARNPRDTLKKKFMASWQQLQNILTENPSLEVLSSLWLFESQQQGHDFSALRKVIDRYAALVAAIHDLL
jgi:ADP-heptose:LPS heptosyltransferase